MYYPMSLQILEILIIQTLKQEIYIYIIICCLEERGVARDRALLMVRWVVGSIPHGGTIEIYRSTTGVTKAVVCAILSSMVHIKESLLLIELPFKWFFMAYLHTMFVLRFKDTTLGFVTRVLCIIIITIINNSGSSSSSKY